MRFFSRNIEDMVTLALQQLSENTNISQLTPGGKARFLIDTVLREQSDQHAVFNNNLTQAFILYADDEFLDYFGDMLNKPRRGTTFAESLSTEQNFIWYVNSGTFGDINSNSEFIIPAGTQVTNVPFEGEIATPGLETQPTVAYTTTESITCQPDKSFAYCGVRASIEGKDSNVPRNVLVRHGFTNYSLSDRGLLKCTNRHAISTGQERETSNAYRYRLLNVFRSKEQAVKTAIRLAALSVPGVANITEVNFEQGPGTYSVYVQATTPTTSQGLINQVTDAVAEVSSFGVRPYILAPNPIGIELIVAVTWSPKASDAQKAAGYAAIRNNIENSLGYYNIGDNVFLADLIRLTLSSSEYILGVGREIPNAFEKVYLTRSSADGTGITRSLFTGDTIVPLYNERIILETSGRSRGIEFLT